MQWFRALLLVCLPVIGLAEEMGRELNWQTPTAPNYTEQILPSVEAQGEGENFKLPALPDVEPGAAPVLSQTPLVFVRDIQVEGATVFSSEDLQAVTQAYDSRQVSSADLQALRLKLSKMYLESGYVNSGIVIPDQSVVDGTVVLRAIEGELTRIEIEGDTHLRDHYITSRLRRHIDEPLNLSDIRYALQHLQRDQHVDRLDARLAPGDALGESVLHLAVDEADRFELVVGVDNHQSSSVGAERGILSATARNLTGFGDVLQVTAAISEGADDGAASYEIPVTRSNTTLRAYYSRTDSKIVEDAFDNLDIESVTDTWGVSLIHPLIDNLSDTFSVSIGFEVKHSETELLGLPFSFSPGAQDGEADTSSLQLGLDWVRRGDNHVLALRGTFRRGLDTLDATIFDRDDPNAFFNTTGADGEFELYLLQGLWLYRLNQLPGLSELHERAQLVFRTTAQISDDPLMSLEKLAIGGVNTVRGYPENLLVRDNGVGATLELQLPVFGFHGEPHPLNLIFAPFVDYGRSWDEEDTDPTSTTRDTDDARFVLSAGLGLLWQPIHGLRAQVYWGEDIDDNFDQDDPRDSNTRDRDLQDDGVHFALSYVLPI